MKTELHKSFRTSERPQEKKSSCLSSEKIKMTLPQPTPTDASLVPLPSSTSSSDDDEESPSKEFLKNYSPKTTIHSNVSVQNLIVATQKDGGTSYLKSPLNTPMEKSVMKKKRTKSSKLVSSAIKQEKMPQNLLDSLRQVSSSEESSSPGEKGHKSSIPGKKGHESSSPRKKGQKSSIPVKKGHESSSPDKRGHESSSPDKRGHESSSPDKRGHESSSPDKRCHESNSSSKKGHESNSPRKKVRSKDMTHVDSQPKTPTRPLPWRPMEIDQLTQSGHQMDTGEHSDDSSGSSSLADSSSEDGGPTPAMEERRRSEGDLTEDEEEDGAKTPKQMRFKAPEHYTECSVQNKEFNKEDAADCDLWLIKVPHDLDVADMDKKCVTIGGTLMVKRTTEKDGADRVWEMAASHDDTLEASTWCVMLPSKTDNKLSPVGPFNGHICLTRSVQSLPYVLPPVPMKHVHMPEGLKTRNVPFGADAPVRRKSKKKDRKSWQGDNVNMKKHKRKHHQEANERTADVMKEEPADWTTVKHHKKHKTHKRH